jgi:hypothetical protein
MGFFLLNTMSAKARAVNKMRHKLARKAITTVQELVDVSSHEFPFILILFDSSKTISKLKVVFENSFFNFIDFLFSSLTISKYSLSSPVHQNYGHLFINYRTNSHKVNLFSHLLTQKLFLS